MDMLLAKFCQQRVDEDEGFSPRGEINRHGISNPPRLPACEPGKSKKRQDIAKRYTIA